MDEHQNIEYFNRLKKKYYELRCTAIKRGYGFAFRDFEEFKQFMINNNYEFGMNIMRRDLSKPFSVDNCYLSYTFERLFEGKTLKEWGKILKLEPRTVYDYLLKGKSIQYLLKTYPRRRKKGHPLLRTWENIKMLSSERGGMRIGWKDFWDFVKWSEENGWSPGKQLIRKFKDVGYTKDNCCWSHRKYLSYRYKNRSMFFRKLKEFYAHNEKYRQRYENRKASCRKYRKKLRYKLFDINQRRHDNVQISKSNDPRIVKNDPYLSLYLQSVTDTSRTSYIGLPEVFEDIRNVIPNMTPERGRSANPKMQPLPDTWQFCNILNKVNHDDPDEFEARIADVLFWTLPFAGNPVCCIPLRRNEDYLIQTKETTGQYTLDLFADDAVADVLAYHKFWEKPEKDDLPADTTALAAQVAFDVLKDLNKKGLSCFSSNSQYIQKTFLKGMSDKNADKVADLAEQLLITSGLMDNTNRKTDDNDIRLSLSCLGESFVNIIDNINPGKINYLYFRNYDMNFRFALCERIAKQIVADGYDFYMSIEKTERSEKRSVAKPVKTKEPLNIWETYIIKPEEKKPAPKFVEPESPEIIETKEVIDETTQSLNGKESSIQEIQVYPKALNEQEVKEEMHRPIGSSETEENKSYTSNLTPRPPFVPPQDPLVLARDTDKVDEDRVLALSQNITEFMVKEKTNLPPNVKTALKEALMALMEL